MEHIDILKKDGLTLQLLEQLSYKSELGINLKKNLHYFDKQKLFDELAKVYDNNVGCILRQAYEKGTIRTEMEFKEVLTDVLLNSKKI